MKTIVFRLQKTILLKILLVAILIYNTKVIGQQEVIKTIKITNKLPGFYKETTTNNYQARKTEITKSKLLIGNNNTTSSRKENILLSMAISIGLGGIVLVYLKKRRNQKIDKYDSSQNTSREFFSYTSQTKESKLSATLIAQEKKIKKLTQYNSELFEAIEKSVPQDLEKAKQDINQLINDLKLDNILSQNIEELKKIRHSRLLYILKQRHPKLSKTDLKHCLFIHIQLSLKETAALLHVTIATVKSGRHRAKRKINLPPNISFREYLDQINDQYY